MFNRMHGMHACTIMSSTSLSLFDRQFHVLTSRLDRLEEKMERLLNNVLTEVNNWNKPKDLPLDEFFSRFCTLEGINEDHPTARACMPMYLQ